MKRKNLRILITLAILMLVASVILVPSSIVLAQTLSLSPASGAPGTGLTISGSGFTTNTSGWVWFDSDGDSVRDTTEPQVSVATTGTGSLPSGTTLAIPSVTPATYQVRADIPTGAPVEASAPFTVLPTPSMSVSPTSGVPGGGITITGSAFTPSTAGWVWFDSNGDGVRDVGEPQVSVTTTGAGAIPSGITMAVPTVAPGTYLVRADIPTDGSVEASATFTVPTPTISLSPASGVSGTVMTISGSGFSPNTAGWLWFDSNGDSVRDAGEPQASVTTTATGAIPGGITLTVPTVAPGTYLVRADIPAAGSIEAATTFTVPAPSISVSPTSGVSGTVITITGSGFTPNTTGWVWFDSNGDSVRDAGEPQVSVTTTGVGAVPSGTTLTAPALAPGMYLVRADIPAGGGVEAADDFTIPVVSISVSPTSGASGTVVTVSGSGFAPNTAGWVWFDSNRDSVRDAGEPQVSATTTAAGAIPSGITLTVSGVSPGTYWVRADIPTGGSVEASATFTVPSPSISVSPTSGVLGTVVTVSGSGFTPNTAGWVWFDSNGDGVRDAGEPQVSVTTTAAGALPSGVALTIPSVVPGTYLVLADIPASGSVEAAATFTVPSPSITLSPTSGVSGMVITITGSGFAPNTAGWVWFDSNRDSVRDAGEPQVSLTTTAAGALPAGITLTVPTVAAGGHRVLADVPTGGVIEDLASFTVSTASISLSPTSGALGTMITVTGSGFAPNTAGWVWFDSNGDGVRDPGERGVPVTTSAAGAIPGGTILAVPNVAPGIYQVRADIPSGGSIEASASFTVPIVSIALSPASGAPGTVISITGSGFTPNTAGWVWFDSNGDSVRDAGEPQVPVTTTSAGAIPSGVALTVPAVAAGGYQVYADIPAGGTIEASASFTVVVRAIALSPVSGAPGTAITITGSGFTLNTAGWLWFDSNGDSVRDVTEPQVPVTTTSAGAIPSGVTLTIPTVAAGGYQVLADIPAGGTAEASASFTVVVRAIALSPASGAPGTVITITGNGFTSDTAGWVWFDSNGDSVRDAGEPQVSMTTTTAGFIPTGVTLTVPTGAAPLVYQVLGDIPTGGTAEASASFAVTPPPSAGLLLGSARGEIILAPGASVDVLVPSAIPFMGTIGIQSTGLRYDVDIWTTTAWSTVVEAGARNASYAVSGFGLRISNDTAESMMVSYVIVYLRQ